MYLLKKHVLAFAGKGDLTREMSPTNPRLSGCPGPFRKMTILLLYVNRLDLGQVEPDKTGSSATECANEGPGLV